MRLDHDETHYDILEVSPSCNAAELREAYQRIKQTFSRDSNALYTMMDTSEREALLERIEKAYATLSDFQSRRDYDLEHGLIDGTPTPSESAPVLFSIDRVPPMDPMAAEESLLVPPATDSAEVENTALATPPEPLPVRPHAAATVGEHPHEALQPPKAPQSPLRSQISPALLARFDSEQNWPGDFLRQIRESQHIAIEELAEITKVSKTYLTALEAENFDKLPAAVFVRGFLTQVCRAIKIPLPKIDQAVLAYLRRYRDHVQKKTGQTE